MAKTDQNVLKIRMLYCYTDRKWEIHQQGQSHLMQNCPIAKDFQKLGTLDYALSETKGKVQSHVFRVSLK
jgi:hypothetical protein